MVLNVFEGSTYFERLSGAKSHKSKQSAFEAVGAVVVQVALHGVETSFYPTQSHFSRHGNSRLCLDLRLGSA